VLRRALGIAVVAGWLTPACSSNVPGFCGVSDQVRLAIANVSPAQYPAEAAKHVGSLRDAAADLTGTQGKLASRVANLLAKASEAAPNSLEFTNSYNAFVRASNTFDHRYCNETEAPDF
jgi:hypothetical protein